MAGRARGAGRAGRGGAGAQRRMGGAWYTRTLIQQAEDRTERRKVVYARRLFNDRSVYGFAVRDGRASATVQGTQLDPFTVLLTRPTADPDTVLGVLTAQDATDELTDVARGDLGRTLGGLVLPESADVVVDCTCPDQSGACAHALAVTYEIAAAADVEPGVLLEFAGVPLATLIARVTSGTQLPAVRGGSRSPSVRREGALPGGDEVSGSNAVDRASFYGAGFDLPPLPEPAPVDPLELLDPALLRTALRRSGTRAADIVQATEELGELYARIRRLRPR